jgi:probable blue pigment (indigoidine) exporter
MSDQVSLSAMTGGPAQARRAPHPGRMLIVTAGWGACFVAIRYGLGAASLLWFAALRALLAGLVLLGFARLTRRPIPPRSSWPGIGVLAVVNVTIVFAAMYAGTAGVASGVAAVLANAQPLLIVLPAWLLYQERPHTRTLVALLVGFAGLGIAAAPGGFGGGAVMSLGAAVAITAGTLLARRLGGVDVVMLTAWQFLVGGLLLAGWAAVTDGAPVIAWTPQFVAAVAFLALIGSAGTTLIWFSELQHASLITLSAWTLLTPVFGVGFGWLLVGDRLSGQQSVGIGLVLVALPIILLPRFHHRAGLSRPAELPTASPSEKRGSAPPDTAPRNEG